jgi:hypothetical protein
VLHTVALNPTKDRCLMFVVFLATMTRVKDQYLMMLSLFPVKQVTIPDDFIFIPLVKQAHVVIEKKKKI